MSNLIKELDLNPLEEKVFNCGFLGLQPVEAQTLLGMENAEFRKFTEVYVKGVAYSRLENMERYHDLATQDTETLVQYMEFRKQIDRAILGNSPLADTIEDEPEPLTTLEAIRKLSES